MADNRNIGMTPEQLAAKMQQDLAQTQNNNAAQLASMGAVQEKDGKKYWMGIEVPPEMVGTLQYAGTVLPTVINDWTRGGAYDGASAVFNKLNKEFKISSDAMAGHKAGLAAAATISALLVGLQPISEIAQSARERVRQRKAIKANLSAVLEGKPSAYENNEVIKTAMERTNAILGAGFRQAAGEIPTVALNGYYALQSHKEMAAERAGAAKKNIASDTSSAGIKAGNDDFAQKLKTEKQMRADLDRKLVRAGYTNDRERAGIVNRRIEEVRREERLKQEAKYKTPEEKKKAIDETGRLFPLLGVGILSSFAKHALSKGDAEDAKKTTAYNLIMELQEKINSGHVSENSNLTEQVMDIFQQNEIDRGRSGIGPVLQEKLEPLAKRIGEVIAKKELDAIALVNLVGEGKVMNKRRFVDADRLEELLDEQRKVFGGHEKTPLDEFLADFQSPKLVIAAIKDNLKTLEGKDRAIFAAMFSDDVLIGAGVSKKDIPALRSAGHDAMCEFVKARTIELAQKTPEELKASGLSDKQIEAINTLNEQITQGDDKKIKTSLDGDGGVVGAVRNVFLEKQLKEGKGKGGKAFWTEIINKKAPLAIAPKPDDISKAEAIKNERESGAEIGGIA